MLKRNHPTQSHAFPSENDTLNTRDQLDLESARAKGRASKFTWDNGSPIGIIAVLICVILLGIIEFGKPVASAQDMQKELQAHTGLAPVQPEPYDYANFMAWLHRTNFSSLPGMKMPPTAEWFDVDMALKGKYAYLFANEDTAAVQSLLKTINRYSFMKEIMLSGKDSTQTALVLQLHVLQRLQAEAARPHAKFLDAGCGTGYLLLAWTLMAGQGSRAVGIDVDRRSVAIAKDHITSPLALNREMQDKPRGTAEVYHGDALHPDALALGLEPGSVDAINVGVALESAADLAPLAKLLRISGLMTVPFCKPKAEQSRSVPAGMCAATLQVLRKAANGSMQAEGPGVDVNFVKARHAKRSGPFVAPGRPIL